MEEELGRERLRVIEIEGEREEGLRVIEGKEREIRGLEGANGQLEGANRGLADRGERLRREKEEVEGMLRREKSELVGELRKEIEGVRRRCKEVEIEN